MTGHLPDVEPSARLITTKEGSRLRMSINALTEALFGIYSRAGAEVTYISDRGERRPYWANRYRQTLQRAVENNEVVEFVVRLVAEGEPSRGFGYLKAAGRLDLSVEALVVEQFPQMFSAEVVEVATARLVSNGYQPTAKRAAPSDQPAGSVSLSDLLKSRAGEAFDVRVYLAHDGTLSLRLL
jgi:hypothetical protein